MTAISQHHHPRTVCLSILVLLGFHQRLGVADRAIAPVDSLDDWAIDTRLQCCGTWQKFYAYDDNEAAEKLSASFARLRLRVWPVTGLYVGAEAGVAKLDDDTSAWAAEAGQSESAISDPQMEAGYLLRIAGSIALGMAVRVTLPAGTSWASRDRTDFESQATLGFSFTPRVDFFWRPLYGYRSSGAHSASGHRGGWTVGLAYQRQRFTTLLYFGNVWHRDSNGFDRSLPGGLSLGWELTPGLSLSLEVEGTDDRNGNAVEIVGRSAIRQSELTIGLALRWVLYPGNRRNALRPLDTRRGEDWKW